MCPCELTISFGFLYSGVLHSDIGVLRTGALPCSPERVDVALPPDMSVSSAKNTFFIEDCGGAGKGTLLFSALNRLKVGLGESGEALECSSPAAMTLVWDLASAAA